jgi:hypothetical protein
MSSLFSVLIAAVLGTVLAVVTALGIVNVASETPGNTPPVDKPLVQYGHR